MSSARRRDEKNRYQLCTLQGLPCPYNSSMTSPLTYFFDGLGPVDRLAGLEPVVDRLRWPEGCSSESTSIGSVWTLRPRDDPACVDIDIGRASVGAACDSDN